MKIHLGCGKHVLPDWTNVDAVKHPKAPRSPEHLGVDITKPLTMFDDNSADALMAIHLLEHFYEWEVRDVLTDWCRVLKPGGRIILEMPDVVKACKNIIKGESLQMGMWPLYGDNTLKDPLMCHRWGWTFKTLKPYLQECGFHRVTEAPTEWHGRRQNRDFRLEAVKC